MRESLRECARRGNNVETIPKGIVYKNEQHWRDSIVVPDEPNEDPKTIKEFEDLMNENIIEAYKKSLQCSHTRFQRMVLSKGIDPNVVIDSEGNTALNFLSYHGDWEKLDLLLKCQGIDVNKSNNHKSTPLMSSIRNPVQFHPMRIQRALLAAEADVNLADCRGCTPLHEACLLGHLELIGILLRRQAKVYVLDRNNKCPIEYTPRHVRVSHVLSLVSRGRVSSTSRSSNNCSVDSSNVVANKNTSRCGRTSSVVSSWPPCSSTSVSLSRVTTSCATASPNLSASNANGN